MTKRRKAAKKAAPKAPLKYKLKRAKKSPNGIDYQKTIEFAPRKHEGEKVRETIQAINWQRFNTLQTKGRDPDTGAQVFPRGVYVTYVLKTGRKYHRITDITPRGLHIDKRNVQKWLDESLEKLITKTEVDDLDGEDSEESDAEAATEEVEGKKYDKNKIDFGKTKLLSIEVKYIYQKPKPGIHHEILDL